jgi:hypothetical protein
MLGLPGVLRLATATTIFGASGFGVQMMRRRLVKAAEEKRYDEITKSCRCIDELRAVRGGFTLELSVTG